MRPQRLAFCIFHFGSGDGEGGGGGGGVGGGRAISWDDPKLSDRSIFLFLKRRSETTDGYTDGPTDGQTLL